MSSHQFVAQRLLGIELGGAKNQKTAVAVLEYYAREEKTFLLDIFEGIGATEEQTADENLLHLIEECDQGAVEGLAVIACNVPLDLPPCLSCTRAVCPLPADCTVPTVKWMRSQIKKANTETEFTPYTQRPFEIYCRSEIFDNLSARLRFDIDESMGGSKAPLTARMHFLQKHLKDKKIIEVYPKLTLAQVIQSLKIPHRHFENYRDLEEGVSSRAALLDALVESCGVFLYDRDIQKLTKSLGAFHAFITAFTALLFQRGQCASVPRDWPLKGKQGWVAFPDPLRMT